MFHSETRSSPRAALAFTLCVGACFAGGCTSATDDPSMTSRGAPQPMESDSQAGAAGKAPGSTSSSTGTDGQAADAGLSEVSTDQRLRDLRPEFLDYFWNNLDAARFTAWAPEAHSAFAWTQAPKLPGDLGAELGAAYTARVTIGGAEHAVSVTYVAPGGASVDQTLESAMAADVTIDGAGPYRMRVAYQQEGDDVRVLQRIALPATEDGAAWKAYLEQRMTRLAGFIREPFQKEYVEQELTRRGKIVVIPGSVTMDVVVTQNIARLTTEMVDWWWDNMGETERYRHWHPTAHQSFKWTTPPKNADDLIYDVGSMQKIVEVIDTAATLNIGWLSPKDVPIPLTYEHFIYGSTNLDGTPFGGFLVHEYDALPEGGIVMKSTFRVTALGGDKFAKALGEHCIQEMQFLQYYLPRLFAEEYVR